MTDLKTTIKTARTAAGLSQKRMADALGIPCRTIEDWEAGKASPPPYVEKYVLEDLANFDDEKNLLDDVQDADFADLLKQARKAGGLTQQAAAEKTGIPKRSLVNWETGQRTPPAYVQRYLLKELLLYKKEK